MALIVSGDGRKNTPNPAKIPIYGRLDPPLDADEETAARLPPRFATLGEVTEEKG